MESGEAAMDLSVRPSSTSLPSAQIVRPVPRPPWSIVWYQNLCSSFATSSSSSSLASSRESSSEHLADTNGKRLAGSGSSPPSSTSFSVLNFLAHSDNGCDRGRGATSRNFLPQPFISRGEHLSRLRVTGARYPSSDVALSSSYTSSFHPIRLDSGSQEEEISLPLQAPPISKESSCSEDDDDTDENDNVSQSGTRVVLTTTASSTSTGVGISSPYPNTSLLKSVEVEGDDLDGSLLHQATVVLDIACCDGPVQFKRISNPNFALTVEHSEGHCPDTKSSTITMVAMREANDDTTSTRQPHNPHHYHHHHHSNNLGSGGSGGCVTPMKTYLCIYCNQSFKSLFCYQKHKKRHLNPVSVDITTTTNNNSNGIAHARVGSGNAPTTSGGGGGGGSSNGGITASPESAKAKTKDLNVQFFPCKKCGCKFPSYYFVHKHRKVCH